MTTDIIVLHCQDYREYSKASLFWTHWLYS